MDNINIDVQKVGAARRGISIEIENGGYLCNNNSITKAQLAEIQEQFRRQKEEYERQNRVFIADERKKALAR